MYCVTCRDRSSRVLTIATSGIDGNVISQCICTKNNCTKFHGITKIGEIRTGSGGQINAVALCNNHIVCAGSDGSLTFYDAQYSQVHQMNTGGSSVKHLTAETFMGKDLIFWSMDVLMPALGGVPLGVVSMMDFASLATQSANPPTVTAMVSHCTPSSPPLSRTVQFAALLIDPPLLAQHRDAIHTCAARAQVPSAERGDRSAPDHEWRGGDNAHVELQHLFLRI